MSTHPSAGDAFELSPDRRLQVALIGLGRKGRFHIDSVSKSCPSIEFACVSDVEAARSRIAADKAPYSLLMVLIS